MEPERGGWRLHNADGGIGTRRVFLCADAFQTDIAERLAGTVGPLRVYRVATAPLL